MTLSDPMRQQIENLVSSNRVVLFMKGNRRFPQCGFSATVVGILDQHLSSYETVNVLADPQIRDGIKAYSEWPTIPQLYVAGKFVGGCDIVREMQASGELEQLLGGTKAQGPGGEAAPEAPPKITVTPAAAAAFQAAAADAGDDVLRLEVSPQFQYDLFFGPRQDGDIEVATSGLTLRIDRKSARRADGLSIDFVDGPSGAGFKLENPNEPPKVRQITAVELKGLLDSGKPVELFDVRTEAERAIATIAGARHLDQAGQDHLSHLDPDALVVFHCHHGGRSQSAAEQVLRAGFHKVYNLQGGIDAWSRDVDPSVPRY
jgi:monothiol glutaredoxin